MEPEGSNGTLTTNLTHDWCAKVDSGLTTRRDRMSLTQGEAHVKHVTAALLNSLRDNTTPADVLNPCTRGHGHASDRGSR